MSRWLKQSTAQTERIGPFLDATDGVTEETGLTPATELSKDGGAFAAGPSGTHDAEGWYSVALTATHTNTLGSLVIKSHDSANHLPVWHEFMVLPANIYDSLVAGSDVLDVSVTQWLGTAAATPTVAGVPEVDVTHLVGDSGHATRLRNLAHAISIRGAFTAQAGAAGSITLDASADANDDFYNGDFVCIVDNTGSRQCRLITDYDGTTKVATVVPNWVVTPDATSTFVVIGDGRKDVGQWVGATPNALVSGRVDADAVAISGSTTAADNVEANITNLDATVSSRATPAEVNTECDTALSDIGLDHLLSASVAGADVTDDSVVAQLAAKGATADFDTFDNTTDSLEAIRDHDATIKTDTAAILVDTADMQPKLGTPAGADMSADIAAVQADTDDIQTRLPAALVGGKMDSDVGNMQSGTITAAVVATDAIDADAIATDAVNEIAAAIGPKKNTAFSDLEFLLVDATDGKTPETGLTVTGQRSLDGGSFAAVSGTIAEVGNGIYQFDALAADMNADIVTFRFSAGGALDTFITIKTTP